MYCYYCGNKIDERKANERLLKNYVKDEKRRVKYAIQDENHSFKCALHDLYVTSKKGEDVSALKQELIVSHNKKIEEIKNSLNLHFVEDSSSASDEVNVSYVCPRCGHLIKYGFTQEDKKSLSAATHAELQRSRNIFSRGMAMLVLGVILVVIAVVFFLLCRKASNGYQVTTNVPEFWVFLVLGSLSIILLIVGGIFTFVSVRKSKMYTKLLKDIKNETFVQ